MSEHSKLPKAVNSHDQLVEALAWALKHVGKYGTSTYEQNLAKARKALSMAKQT